jgi:hypothetical protein
MVSLRAVMASKFTGALGGKSMSHASLRDRAPAQASELTSAGESLRSIRLAGDIPAPPKQPDPLDPVAMLTAILDDVPAFGIGSTFLDLHPVPTDETTQQIDQRAFIVVHGHVTRASTESSTGLTFAVEPTI